MPDASMLGVDRSAMIGGDLRTTESGLGIGVAFGGAGAAGAFRRVLDESVAAAEEADAAADEAETADLAADAADGADAADLAPAGSEDGAGAEEDGVDAGTSAGTGAARFGSAGSATGTGAAQAGAPRATAADSAREAGEPDTERSLAPPPAANDEPAAVEMATASASADGAQQATRSQAARTGLDASKVGTLPSPAPEDGSDGAEEVVLANGLHLAGADRLAAEHLRKAAEKARIGEEGLSGGGGEGESTDGASGRDQGTSATANERGALGAATESASLSTGVGGEIRGDLAGGGDVEARGGPGQGETRGLVGRSGRQDLSGQDISEQCLSGATPAGDPRAAGRARSAGDAGNARVRDHGAEDVARPSPGQRGPRKPGAITGAGALEDGAGGLGNDAAAQAAAWQAAAWRAAGPMKAAADPGTSQSRNGAQAPSGGEGGRFGGHGAAGDAGSLGTPSDALSRGARAPGAAGRATPTTAAATAHDGDLGHLGGPAAQQSAAWKPSGTIELGASAGATAGQEPVGGSRFARTPGAGSLAEASSGVAAAPSGPTDPRASSGAPAHPFPGAPSAGAASPGATSSTENKASPGTSRDAFSLESPTATAANTAPGAPLGPSVARNTGATRHSVQTVSGPTPSASTAAWAGSPTAQPGAAKAGTPPLGAANRGTLPGAADGATPPLGAADGATPPLGTPNSATPPLGTTDGATQPLGTASPSPSAGIAATESFGTNNAGRRRAAAPAEILVPGTTSSSTPVAPGARTPGRGRLVGPTILFPNAESRQMAANRTSLAAAAASRATPGASQASRVDPALQPTDAQIRGTLDASAGRAEAARASAPTRPVTTRPTGPFAIDTDAPPIGTAAEIERAFAAEAATRSPKATAPRGLSGPRSPEPPPAPLADRLAPDIPAPFESVAAKAVTPPIGRGDAQEMRLVAERLARSAETASGANTAFAGPRARPLPATAQPGWAADRTEDPGAPPATASRAAADPTTAGADTSSDLRAFGAGPERTARGRLPSTAQPGSPPISAVPVPRGAATPTLGTTPDSEAEAGFPSPAAREGDPTPAMAHAPHAPTAIPDPGASGAATTHHEVPLPPTAAQRATSRTTLSHGVTPSAALPANSPFPTHEATNAAAAAAAAPERTPAAPTTAGPAADSPPDSLPRAPISAASGWSPDTQRDPASVSGAASTPADDKAAPGDLDPRARPPLGATGHDPAATGTSTPHVAGENGAPHNLAPNAPSPTNTAPQPLPTAPASVLSRLEERIVERRQRVAAGGLRGPSPFRGTHAEAQIPDFGRISVDAVPRGSEVDVRVTAHEADAARALREARPALETHLRDGAVPLGHLSVGDPTSGGATHQGPGRERQGPQQDPAATAPQDSPRPALAPRPGARVRIVL